ncbi:MAG TPA: OstA-like protein [Bacteroidales bacterium]|nr:OstA-like protein [Bacteroidales bacterium]
MAKIKQQNISGLLKYLVLLLPALFFISLAAQEQQTKKTVRKKIEVLGGYDEIIKDPTGEEVHHLVGDVRFKHNEVLMFCDSAHYIPSKQQLTGFSNVHIEQGDTLDLYGEYLFYDGMNETAFVRDSVELIDKETHLYTDQIHYDVLNKVANYTTGGRITNADNVLTSKIGVYYVSQSLFHFKDSVKIVNPDYVMKGDTMDYNTKTEISYFTGPTTLTGDSIYLYCEKGWYDTKNEITSVWKNALIDNRKQIVQGDSLFFNDMTGYGEAYRNVTIQDTVNNLAIEGDYAWYYKQPERFLVTEKAVFIQISDEDSLFLHADTISAVTVADTSASGYRLMRAYHKCKVFSKRLQVKCDSLSYSFRDSVIRFYTEPILWAEEYQLLADSMAIFTKNNQAERLELYNSAFVISMIDTTRYNQIKGKSLTGYFKDNELEKIDVTGNVESIYFLIDGNKLTGVNQSRCARIEAFVSDGSVTDIINHGNPEGVIDPPKLNINPAEVKLEGFMWYDNLRPKKKSDIFKD